MSSQIQTTFRAALSMMQGKFTESSVSVSIDGTTGTGLRDTVTGASGLAELGDMGMAASVIIVSRGTFESEPTRGSTIVIDGANVTVSQVQTDPAQAVWIITYSEQQPIA